MNFKELLPFYKTSHTKNYRYKFTVFTPVFNCEKTIEKVHESLLNQTYKNFEWLIINDGSTDKSHEIISTIIAKSPLTINYVNNKVNKHKMSCFIEAIPLAQGEFLLPFDGDDECYPKTLQVFEKEYEDIPADLKSKVAAVTVLCVDQNGKPIGEQFPENPLYCNTFEALLKNQISGEKWGFTKTDVLRGIHVPTKMLNFGFVPESLIWNTVARTGFLTKCVNIPLRIYHVGVENSIMNSPMTSKTAFGTVLNGIAINNWFISNYFFVSPIFFLKSIYVTIRSTKYIDYPLNIYLKSIDSFLFKSLIFVLWPIRKFMK